MISLRRPNISSLLCRPKQAGFCELRPSHHDRRGFLATAVLTGLVLTATIRGGGPSRRRRSRWRAVWLNDGLGQYPDFEVVGEVEESDVVAVDLAFPAVVTTCQTPPKLWTPSP